MNLAIRDVRYKLGRFLLTAVGLGLLLMIVMGMGGIYEGIVADATLLVDELDADLWIVQRNTRGPFAELSRVPSNVEDRARAVPGVADARRFVTHTIQREHRDRPLRMAIVGLAWPVDRGEWLPIIAGRSLAQGHYEIVADQTLGLAVGDRIELGKDEYRIVGITRNMLSSGGDGLAFMTIADSQAVQFDAVGEATRLERAGRRGRAQQSDIGLTQPGLLERADLPASGIPVLGPPMVSAVLVRLTPGTDVESVRSTMNGWPDVTVYTADEQRDLLLRGPVDRARRQIGLFRVLLVAISAIVMSLILYTMTLDKLHDIALLKLMGAKDRMILGLVLQEAFLLGGIAYVLAFFLGERVYPFFPRRVIITNDMLMWLSFAVAVLCVAGSSLGIWKAMRVQPNEVLA
ncbi:MAG: ABC transporter permease [Acidimicrobiia bacterium]|nr:ABC transporter permease [Acidimicrobiia bacterium]NNF43690.1 ABC transporter permease [Phycisphaerales bacterium]